MRSFSADAAIIAGPTLAATAGAVRAGDALLLAAAPDLAAHSLLPFPTYAGLAFLFTCAAYILGAPLLRYRALSTSNAFDLFVLSGGLILALLLLNVPVLVPPLAVAGVGAATALRLVRRLPSRTYSAE
jgi:hypothetical protein